MNTKGCDKCQKKTPREPLKRCTRCLGGYYCGVQCQKQDWEDHRPICDQIQRIILCGMTPLTRTADLYKWRHAHDRHLTLGVTHAAYDLCGTFEAITAFDWNHQFVAITVCDRSPSAGIWSVPASQAFVLSTLSILPMSGISSFLPHVTVHNAQDLRQKEHSRQMRRRETNSKPSLATVFVALATIDRTSYACFVEHLFEEPGVSDLNETDLAEVFVGDDHPWLSALKYRIEHGHCAIRRRATSEEAWMLVEEYWDHGASKFKTRELEPAEQLRHGYIPILAGITLYVVSQIVSCI